MTQQQKQLTKEKLIHTPFGKYFRYLDEIDRGTHYSKEFGSILILEIGRAHV